MSQSIVDLKAVGKSFLSADGTPRVVNPTSVNTFSTLSDFFNIGRGATVGDKYASASDLFGPAAQFFTQTKTVYFEPAATPVPSPSSADAQEAEGARSA